MIKVSVFGRKECDACKAAVEKITYFSEKWGKTGSTSIDFIDMETPDGLAEGAYRDVYEVPTVIFEEGTQEFRSYLFREVVDERAPDKGIR
jgi:hypothetical protein